MKYRKGYFSEPVKAWPGLREYQPELHRLLIVANGMGAVELAQRARDSREARLNGDDVDAKFAARGTITGMGHALFRGKPHANTVSQPKRTRALTYQGRPCRHGHDGTRYKSSSECIECEKARTARRYAAQRAAQ